MQKNLDMVSGHTEYCPDCLVELTKIHRKLDSSTRRIWLKCEKCGFIKRPISSVEVYKELDEFRESHHLDKSTIYRVNMNEFINSNN